MSRFLVCNIGWAQRYAGELFEGQGGGSYVEQYGEGEDKWNFAPHCGQMYGYVAAPFKTIDCDRLAGSKRPGSRPRTSLDGATVVWAAKHPEYGGVYVVGWYQNATVYRGLQRAPAELSHRRLDNDEEWVFNITVKVDEARCLPAHDRTLRVPRGGEGGMGRSNTWYADSARGVRFQQDFVRFKKQME